MNKQKAKDIRLSELLKGKFIELQLKGKDKKKVITELVDLIATSKKLRNKKKFLKAMWEREKLGSTGIGNGVAIPHAKSEEVRNFILAFARAQEGIDFGALDGEKTYLFFALALPKDEVENHLKTLAKISRLVKDKFTVQLLKKAAEKKDILEIISNTENHLD